MSRHGLGAPFGGPHTDSGRRENAPSELTLRIIRTVLEIALRG